MVIVLVLCIRKMIESPCITVCILTVEVIVTMYANFSWSCVAWFFCLRSMFIDKYLLYTYFHFEMISPLMLHCIKTIKHYSSITMSGVIVVLVIHSSCCFTYCFPWFWVFQEPPFASHNWVIYSKTESSIWSSLQDYCVKANLDTHDVSFTACLCTLRMKFCRYSFFHIEERDHVNVCTFETNLS
jgi:hypothetical protein